MKTLIKLVVLSPFISIMLAFGQQPTNNIRGRIIDQDSKSPAIGANIVVVGSDPIIGAVTDVDGYFKIENITVGRYTLKITYMGYADKVMPNVLVTSGKEVYLDIPIMESINTLEEVEIKSGGNKNKNEAMNEMSLVSSRTFSVEETKRYAGTLNDPARMVAAYPGITGDAQGSNEIVVRGNSPKGILWRVEGVEIPNPNHFSDEGATGGPINALNSNMLANSDFSTGAFSPEYGNALSGVFDIKLRQGNNEKREYTVGIGVIGSDITVEGPFKKGGKSSYLANARYSTLAILDNAGLVDFGGVPKYQDASFKMNFPTKKAGTFTLFGLGGRSNISETAQDSNEVTYLKSKYNSYVGFIGASNMYPINEKTYIKTIALFSGNGSNYVEDMLQTDNTFQQTNDSRLDRMTGRFTTSFNRKINAKHKIETGVILTAANFDFSLASRNEAGVFQNDLSKTASSSYVQAYTTWKYRVNDKMTLVNGVHYMQLMLNNTYSVEPRSSIKYQINPKNSLNAGFGMHSKVESFLQYYSQSRKADGSIYYPNKNLKLPKAQHFVLGFDHLITENTHVKLEAYYQNLYNLGVENNTNSPYSIINQMEWYTTRELVSKGKGRNYGLEMTFERFFAKDFFYLLTASVYDSKYTALDGIERDTRFNANYTSNFLIGKEFKVGGAGKNKTIILNAKATLLGGNRYTPVDLQKSREQDRPIHTDNKPFSVKGDDVFFVNLSGSYRINRKKTTHDIKFEVLNATNNKAKVTEYYNVKSGKIENSNQLPLIPNIMYIVQF